MNKIHLVKGNKVTENETDWMANIEFPALVTPEIKLPPRLTSAQRLEAAMARAKKAGYETKSEERLTFAERLARFRDSSELEWERLITRQKAEVEALNKAAAERRV